MKTTRRTWGFYLVLIFLALPACSEKIYNTVPLGSPGTIVPPVQAEYKISVNDKLSIKMFYNPELNQDVVVRPDGRITLQLVNEIKVVGLTPAQLSEQLTESYTKYLAQAPEISVIVNSFGGYKVFVGGEANGGGIKELTGPTTVLGAILMSGGFKDTGDRNQVVVVRMDENNKPRYISLDIEKVMNGKDPAQDIYVQAYDMILVPRTGIANVNVWIDQYFHALGVVTTPLSYYFLFNTTGH
ncbi:MAG: polysaccharide biosynthesis/export family protein [Syntrophobacteraceae bacterium]